ncbi:MAG: hypothetical protein H7256_00435 [Bdellovibrio sp.]|nr:hypothetical protein [Bdellovibrio sp.]
MFQKLITFIFISIFSISAFAGLEEDYLAIKDSGRDFEPAGAICEEVAKLDIQHQFPAPNFNVITGIAYSDQFGTLGELDIIVFDVKSDTAVMFAEVKCWKNPSQGLDKMHDQRDRFFRNIRSGKVLKFDWNFDGTKEFKREQFLTTEKFISIAQKGAKDVGYDDELPYTLKELMQLRARILRCQDLEGCKKPTY